MPINVEDWLAEIDSPVYRSGTAGPDDLFTEQSGEILDGLVGNDLLTSNINQTALLGNVGADTLNADIDLVDDNAALRGLVVLSGGDGNDQLTGRLGLGSEGGVVSDLVLAGGSGNDVLRATAYISSLSLFSVEIATHTDGGDGDDVITASANTSGALAEDSATNYSEGGAGRDQITVSASVEFFGMNGRARNFVDGGADDDFITASADNNGNGPNFAGNELVGGDGNDRIRGSTFTGSNSGTAVGVNELMGGAGDDQLEAFHGTTGESMFAEVRSDLDGGGDDDRLFARSEVLAVAVGTASHDLAGGGDDDSLTSIIDMTIVDGRATGSNLLDGGAGEDSLVATLDASVLSSDSTLINELRGGADGDSLAAGMTATLRTFEWAGTFVARNALHGDGGNDIIDASLQLTVDYFGADPVGSPLLGENRLEGGEGDDVLTASITFGSAFGSPVGFASSFLYGGDDNDSLTVVGGTDNLLDGGSGDDVLDGDTGNDRLLGGSGFDIAVFTGKRADYSITRLSDGSYRVADLRSGNPDGTDLAIDVERFRFADGTFAPDDPVPPPPPPPPPPPVGRSYVGGTRGDDDLRADYRNPDGTILFGNEGNDILRGGGGGDLMTGGAGNDQMFGGGGGDQFRFFGSQIEGASDRDRVYDLDFAEGDVLVFGNFAAGTFLDAGGVNAFAGGSAAVLDSYSDLFAADNASDRVSVLRASPYNDNLLVRVADGDGQVQEILITGGWPEYLAAASGVAP